MKRRCCPAMFGMTNDYSILKWPLLSVSVLATITALLLLLSFLSQSWFDYDMYETRTEQSPWNSTFTTRYLLAQGSFGIRKLCIRQANEYNSDCDTWTRVTRPQSFSVIFALLSIALFLSNLVLFPSWLSLIFVLYNVSNRYIRYIVALIWTELFFILLTTCVLLCAVILIGTSPLYSPGEFTIESNHLIFYLGSGLHLMFSAAIFVFICLTLLVLTLIGKQYIEMKLVQIEKDLFRQLYDDNYRPSWDRIPEAPRPKRRKYKPIDQSPPPYSSYSDDTDN